MTGKTIRQRMDGLWVVIVVLSDGTTYERGPYWTEREARANT